jgi:hypothetical protein
MTPAEMTEVERLRAGLQFIADDHARNRWHPDTTYPTELSREWHNGYITCAAHHAIEAKKYLDPEGAAEDDAMWRLGHQGTDAEWWQKTGHCGHCGLIGSSCDCEGECECASLHGRRLPDWKPPSQRAEEAEALLAAVRAELDRAEALAGPMRWFDDIRRALGDMQPTLLGGAA